MWHLQLIRPVCVALILGSVSVAYADNRDDGNDYPPVPAPLPPAETPPTPNPPMPPGPPGSPQL